MGISLEPDFVLLLNDTFTPTMAPNMATLCRLLRVTNSVEYSQLLYTNDDRTLTLQLQKLISPLMRRKVILCSLLEIVNAAKTLFYKVRALPPALTRPVGPPTPMVGTRNAPNRMLLTPLISAGTQTAKRCRDAAYAPSTGSSQEQHPPAPSQASQSSLGSAPSQIGATAPPAIQKPYIRRAQYMNAEPKPKPAPTPQTDDLRTGCPSPWETILLFRNESTLFNAIKNAHTGPDETRTVFHCAFSARCSSPAGLRKICKFAAAYHQFCVRPTPNLALVGPDSVVPLAQWLLSLHGRGRTVSRTAKYCLKVFGEALGLDFQVSHPAAMAAVTSKVVKLTKQAPCIPLETIKVIERLSHDPRYPSGLRYFAACVILMTLASFRYKNTTRITDIRYDITTISGMCAPCKSNKSPFTWAIPAAGFVSEGKWFDIIVETRDRHRSWTGLEMNFLFLKHNKDWSVDEPNFQPANYAQTLYAFRALFSTIGQKSSNCTLHSPRTVLNTYAAQLGWHKEERSVIGRWAHGSAMPDTYDRARCVTELKLRSSVLENIANGWNPVPDFQLPMKQRVPKVSLDAVETSSCSDTSSGSERSETAKERLGGIDVNDDSMSGYKHPV